MTCGAPLGGSALGAACLVIALVFSPSQVLVGQDPDDVLSGPARLVALGETGAALFADPQARWANPAAIAGTKAISFAAGITSIRATDDRQVSFGAAMPVGRLGLALDSRFHEVRDVVSDPELATLPGFRVYDLAVSAGAGLRITPRLHLGASWEWIDSRVFGSSGHTVRHSIGIVGLPVSHMAGALVLRNFGAISKWRNGEESFSTELAETVSAAVSTAWSARLVNVQVSADVDHIGTGRDPLDVAVGVEVGIAKTLHFRAGMREMLAHPTVDLTHFGLGFVLGPVTVDFTRRPLGPLGSQLLVDVRFERQSH